ncbi:MAG: nickel pincer cofactor biosynthesis protein LarC [Thermodesulfovibrionia bacterium]|nr:nickel pincer cofactor biosynthesis protein LarC [Thermodesulfovibrionia bacterium]
MICYFNCSSGISGDMILGALVDAGLPPQKLKKSLSRLPITGYKLNIKKVKRAGIQATKVNVEIHASRITHHAVQKWKDIEKIIKNSTLSDEIKQKGLRIFKRLFEAEAKVHGERFEDIHLHELGAIDCIIDVFGTLIGIDILGIKKIYSSPLNLGSGTIKTGHGILPVPAPATAELLKNVPVYSSDINFELTTPTGAVLISTLADSFGPMPDMQISKIGTGAGSKDFKKQPNVLRVFIGEETENTPPCHSRESRNPEKNKLDSCFRRNDENQGGFSEQKITIIETNIDDMNPQIYEYIMEKLFKAGALDVFLTQVIMKKGRPGIKLTALCSEDKRDELIEIILKETTSIGVRFYETQRKILQRTIESVDTKFGKIKVKISRLGADMVKITPEYEDCKKIAKKFNIPLIEVIKSVSSTEK